MKRTRKRTPMINMDEERERAEEQLLYLLRLQGVDNFTLKILHSDGRWTVELESIEAPGRGIGEGATLPKRGTPLHLGGVSRNEERSDCGLSSTLRSARHYMPTRRASFPI